MTNRGFASKVCLEEVSTTCGSGWVDDRRAILLMILEPWSDPPATAGGTDPFQARSPTSSLFPLSNYAFEESALTAVAELTRIRASSLCFSISSRNASTPGP